MSLCLKEPFHQRLNQPLSPRIKPGPIALSFRPRFFQEPLKELPFPFPKQSSFQGILPFGQYCENSKEIETQGGDPAQQELLF